MPAPPAIPALPDTQRLTSYLISAQTGPFAVNFALYGDGNDYGNWIEVWLNDFKLTAATDYTLSSPSGTIGSIALPITDAVINLTVAQTGTLVIIGARRPRRITQFTENRGVAARDLNETITDIVGEEREAWDFARTRQMYFPGGETVNTLLVPAAQRASKFLFFDASGNPSFVTGNPNPPPTGRTLQPAFVNKTVYVSTAGNNNTGDGTSGNPWATPFHAFLQLLTQYDGSTEAEATIQLANGTYNIPAADGTCAYQAGAPVGWVRINIVGNPASPGSVILDGSLCGNNGTCFYLSQTAGGANMGVNGVQIQNWGSGFNSQSPTNTFYPQNIIFAGNMSQAGGVACFQIEGGFVEVSGPITFGAISKPLVATIGLYINGGDFDWNNEPITFNTASFSYAFLNIDNMANVNFNPSTVTGTTTGAQYFVNNGSKLNIQVGDVGYTAPSTVPGTAASGRNYGGWVNNMASFAGPQGAGGTNLIPTVSQLYSVASVGSRTIVSDATATTFNSIVAGGGANIVPVWFDGTNWRIG
jgi:hypothetical protein